MTTEEICTKSDEIEDAAAFRIKATTNEKGSSQAKRQTAQMNFTNNRL